MNQFKVGDWVVRKSDVMGSVWINWFPTSYDKPKRVSSVGEAGRVKVDGYDGLDRYFKLAPPLKPFREEDYL